MNYRAEIYLGKKLHSYQSERLEEVASFLRKYLLEDEVKSAITSLSKQTSLPKQFPNVVYFLDAKIIPISQGINKIMIENNYWTKKFSFLGISCEVDFYKNPIRCNFACEIDAHRNYLLVRLVLFGSGCDLWLNFPLKVL